MKPTEEKIQSNASDLPVNLILVTGILAMEFIMLMIRDMAAGIIFGMMIMMTMMIGTTKIGIMTTGMMRMTSSWMIIGRWRVLVPGS